MNTRYLEIDSTYRDRSKFPNPGEFEIQISQSGRKGRYDALDPVSLATPTKVWKSNNFNSRGVSNGITLVLLDPTTASNNRVGYTDDPAVLVMRIDELVVGFSLLHQESDYYVGAILTSTSGGLGVGVRQPRRIIRYDYLGKDSDGHDKGIFTLSLGVGDLVKYGDTYSVYDATDFTDLNNPIIFVPYGYIQQNAYNNSFLYNEDLNQSRPVKYYYNTTNLLTVDTTQSVAATTISGPVTGWTMTQNYSIRTELPSESGSLAVNAPSSLVIKLPLGSSTVNGYYDKQYIRMTNSTNNNEIRMIVKYVGDTTREATILSAFPTLPLAGDFFEILNFSYDNASPFVYSGSIVSQQEETCYAIELVQLVLPNRILDSGRGGRIAFYPYVYVELVNVSGSSAGMKHIIYSNNPNSANMLFRATIDDVQNPLVTTFVKINGDNMTQTVKFKINDSLRFSVRLANGEVYKTLINDTLSPYAPNFDYQISALFSLKRL